MTEKDKILEAITKLCKNAPCDEVLVTLYNTKRHSNRFSSNSVRETVFTGDSEIYIKVSVDKKIGVSLSETLDYKNLEHSLDKAIQIARHSRKNPNYKSFLAAPWHNDLKISPYNITKSSISEIFNTIKTLMNKAEDCGIKTSGSLIIGEDTFAVFNSKGLALYQPMGLIYAKILAMSDKLTGFGSFLSRDIAKLNLAKLFDKAQKKCSSDTSPRAAPIGKYRVFLEPQAVADILEWMGYIGFGAKSIFEKRSFLYGRFGQKIMSDKISIYDDATESGSYSIPFDFEGVSKKRVELVKNGIANGVVYDSYYGGIYARQSTGHATTPDSTEGPLPNNLSIMPGDSTMEEMVKTMDEGIYVSRFHYINGLLEPRNALMTGLTRDGTFFVKNGVIKFPIKNLRFTQGMLDAFSNIEKISRERELIGDPFQSLGAFCVPALLINNFTFTGISE